MNDKIKTAINVGAVVLVPLINERQKIKETKEFKKAKNVSVNALYTTKDVTVDTSKKIAHAAVKTKDGAVATGQFAKQTALTLKEKNEERSEKKQEKKKEKEVEKLSKTLEKNINVRQKEEEKLAKKQEKELKKQLKEAQNLEKEINKNDSKAGRLVKKQVSNEKLFGRAQTNNVQDLNELYVYNDLEEDYSNEPLFSKHRRLMQQHIDNK